MTSSVKSQGYVYMVARMGVVSLFSYLPIAAISLLWCGAGSSMKRLALGVIVYSRKLSSLSQGEAVPPEDHS